MTIDPHPAAHHGSRSSRTRGTLALRDDPTRQAFVVLRGAFTVAPIAFGLDKATNLLTDWPAYLAPRLDRLVPGTAQQAMWLVGVVEVVAGLVVAFRPRFGAPLVAAWLAGIVVDLLVLRGHDDVALRDVGLMLAALALWRLAVGQERSRADGVTDVRSPVP